MVTLYRKAQIKNYAASNETAVQTSSNWQSGRFNGSDYVGIISPDDDLPYVMVRPKSNRKKNSASSTNGKKILRMRSSWD